MPLRIDNIQFASSLPNYINLGTGSGTISISGNVLNGNTANFATSVITSTKANRSDVFAKNVGTNIKQLVSTSNYLSNDAAPGGGVYQHISTELAQMSTAITSGLTTITISVFNGTGGTITLVTQSITISVVEYQIPF